MKNPAIDQYISGLDQAWWQKTVKQLRQVVHQADPEIVEEIKWGTPFFSHQGGVAWIFCAKLWVHLGFPQGALLDDSHGLFEPTNNKAKRTIKITEGQAIPTEIIAGLVKQAVENNLGGRKVTFKPAPKQSVELPHDVSQAINMAGLEDDYWVRPYYQQKGYLQWIGQAKHDETRQKRIAKMLNELREGTYMPPRKK